MHELPTGTAVQEAAGCTVGTSQLSAPRELVSVHSERLMSIADRTHVCEHGGTEELWRFHLCAVRRQRNMRRPQQLRERHVHKWPVHLIL